MGKVKEREYVLVSSCLLGLPVRWHGKKQRPSSFVVKFFLENPQCIPVLVCPEVLGGLSVPREPVKRRKGKVFLTCEEKEKRKYVTGKEVTQFFVKGAEETLKIAKRLNVKRAILTKWSPSCDKNGITGKLLQEYGIEIINTF